MERFQKAQGWSILLADDCQDCMDALTELLQIHDIVVHQAFDGVQALKLLETLTPDVVLLDIRMPQLDGWATIAAIRENPHTVTLPVIAISAFSHIEYETKATGFNGTIDKITDADKLVERIYTIVCQNDDGTCNC